MRNTLQTISGSINVRDFGAKGDGATDDRASINNALASAPSGGAVFIPAASFAVSGTITVPAGKTLQLDAGATLALANSANATVVNLAGAGSTLTGGTISANGANQSGGSGVTIASGATGAAVRRVTVANAYLYGIYAPNSNYVTIEDCVVTDSGNIGIFIEASAGAAADVISPTIRHCRVDRTGKGTGVAEGGIKVHGNGTYKVLRPTVLGCRVLMPFSPTDTTAIPIEIFNGSNYGTVNDNHTLGGSMGISIDRSDHSTVVGNQVYGANVYGIELAGSKYCTVAGNTIDGKNDSGTVIMDEGISLTGSSPYSDYAAITGNTIRNYTAVGIHTRFNARGSITGNGIDHVNSGNTYGIHLQNANGIDIVGNHVFGNLVGLKGVLADKSNDINIVGNYFKNLVQETVLVFADAAGTYSNFNISGNLDVGSAAVNTQTSGGATISGMRVFTGAQWYLDFVSNVRVLSFAATPEGAVTAGIGSLCLRTNGGAGTSLYVKESGTGNTGWAAK